MTAAKIGRSTKKCEKRMSARRRLVGFWRDGPFLRRHLGAGPGTDQAVDHKLVVGAEAAPDDTQTTGLAGAGTDDFRPHDAVLADGEHHLARLIGDDRRVRDQDRIIFGGSWDPDAAELAGRDQIVRIGEGGTAADRAAALVDHIVDEAHGTLVRPAFL